MMNKAEITRLIAGFKNLSVLIIGDVMVDRYIHGKVDRISPEAPVPVISVEGYENRLGGAANVARNISALGAKATLAGTIGNDANGDLFLSLLEKESLSGDGIIRTQRRTTVKTRVIGNHYQLLRIDEEDNEDLSGFEEKTLTEHLLNVLNTGSFDVVIFEDYDKGLLNSSLIERVISTCNQRGIPVAVDPKKRNFTAYRNADLFKPNLKEMREGLKIDVTTTKQSMREADKHLRAALHHKISLITLSEAGIFVSDQSQEFMLPAHVRNIADVSGAGDTVISVAALCLASGASLETLAALSNLAGGIVCEQPGVVPIDADRLFHEAQNNAIS
jgi:rfaE bifunctional protein kinase chain/domain